MAPSVTYLGHKIDEKGLHPITEKVKAINAAPPTSSECATIKSLLRIAQLLWEVYTKSLNKPLYKLLKADQQWKWTKTEATAFQNSKELLTSSQLLVHFDPHKKLILSWDASAYGIGAVLAHQSPDGLEQPIGFISRTLSPAEKIIGERGISMRLWSQTIPLLFLWTSLCTGHRSQAITKSTK